MPLRRFILITGACVAGIGAVGSANAAMLTEEVCRDILAGEAAIGVAYQPGVDSRGRRVRRVSADAQNTLLTEPIDVDISIRLQDRNGIPANANLFRGEIPVGRATVRRDGRVEYAGRRLSSNDQQDVRTVCRRAYGVRE